MIRYLLLAAAFLTSWTTLALSAETYKTTIKNQRFVPAELHFKAETPVVLQVTNEDNVPVEFESSDLNKEKMVFPGKSIEFSFKGLKPGVYEFFSDFGPRELRGRIVVE